MVARSPVVENLPWKDSAEPRTAEVTADGR